MIIDYKKVLNTNTDFYKNYYTFDNTHHFAQITGQHYKLLTYVSHLFDGKTILDVGTYDGGSCLALAQNKKNTIITYDVVNEYYKEITELPFIDDYENVTRKIMDINDEDAKIINSADIIMLDIMHDGVTEQKFSDMLSRIGYKGYVFCDDVFSQIHPRCTEWFDKLEIEKYNLTEVGSNSGTGLLNYHEDNSVVIKKD